MAKEPPPTPTSVLVAIDTESIQDAGLPSGSKQKPTVLDSSSYVYAITNSTGGVSFDGHLHVQVSAGDQIDWRVTSLAGNFKYSVMFYNMTSSPPPFPLGMPIPFMSLSKPSLAGGVRKKPRAVTETLPKYKMTGPWEATTASAPYFHYKMKVEASGYISPVLGWQFMIADSHGEVQGYYQWDTILWNNAPA